ncbi:SDR family NAD(P)-dependent oxidoreductase [Amycolatopsis keratiniphila]|uniref:SDR family NAD(P)-dependent oxidoreductase n=1 Tax=Amycolatopsis keratiniphila TaxID=129921 RepID=UPI00087AAA41|nr:SDR family oxidoreductase [Amycolatopsis keratiniphila]OLZ49902.1 3-oxoacyl-ACP reductase [Amycolatopsis keratiniphila subsp. nogabecina]SDU25702.1 3-oxoacyl-[acyl-carrier protein] reductase [Amycolatopsis keratiniphila]
MTRTILVTGGGTGIGRAVAARFAASDAVVYITGRRKDVLVSAAADLGPSVRPLVCDGTDPEQVTAALDALDGPIDVLVNNAGGNTDFDLPEQDGLAGVLAHWRANLDANLISAVLTTTAVQDKLVEGGSVIHIGSIAADQGAGSYGAAKAGLASWNVDLAKQLGARKITANVVSPGYIRETEFFRDKLPAERAEQLVDATSTGRAGIPADIAETVYFLASAGARHITGQTFGVNGGAHPTR